MKTMRPFVSISVAVISLAWAAPAHGLANRVFASARAGSDANGCDNVNTPCQTFAGAIAQVGPDGVVIVLDSGGYGPVTITTGVTIEAAAGVTAFIHPPSGDAITINAGFGVVTLRGLTMIFGLSTALTNNNGITVNSVGTLNVESCFISEFRGQGIAMLSGGQLNLKRTHISGSGFGVLIANTTGGVQATIDNCHFDGNFGPGFEMAPMNPGFATVTASYTTADNNQNGWAFTGSGLGVASLEFCSGSQNSIDGLFSDSAHVASVVRYSNGTFASNGFYGVEREGAGAFETRGNNTITGNGVSPTHGGAIGSFSPM